MSYRDDSAVLLERLSRILQNDAHAEGLKPTQWEVLRYLARANRFSCNPSAVTAYLGMTKGTVSQTLKALELKGLVQKSSDPSDRRNVQLSLTSAGTALLKRDPVAVLSTSIEQLSRDRQRHLSASLRQLLSEALRRRNGRPFGLCRSCRYFQKHARNGAPYRCRLLELPLTADDSERICVEQIEAA